MAAKYKRRAIYTSQRPALSMENAGKMRLSLAYFTIIHDELSQH